MTVATIGFNSSPEVDDFLAHYGVKGMRWGVRKEQDSGPRIVGSKELVAKRTAQSLTVVGAAYTGRILGSVGGTTLLGPGIGTALGGIAGGAAANSAASRVVYGNMAKARKEAKANLPGLMPQRSPKYSDRTAKRDVDRFGADGAQRINRSMLKGKTLAEARTTEQKLQLKANLTALGLSFAQVLVMNKAVKVLSNPEVQRRGRASAMGYAQKKGAARAARNSPVNKIGPALQFVKPSRKGVYNLTTAK